MCVNILDCNLISMLKGLCGLTRSFLWLVLVREVSWSLSCPLYCGGSAIPFVAVGFVLGFSSCITLLFLTVRALGLTLGLSSNHQPRSGSPGSPVDFGPRLVRRSSRLSGYLHE